MSKIEKIFKNLKRKVTTLAIVMIAIQPVLAVGIMPASTYAATDSTGVPTAAAGPYINAVEETTGFDVVVPLGTSGAVPGDTLELLLGGDSFTTPLTTVLTDSDITSGEYTFNVVHGQLGADSVTDGDKVITAKVGDEFESAPLNLTLDTVAPTAVIAYSPIGGVVKEGDTLGITATFSEAIADTPVMQISLSGVETLADTDMSKVDATHYTYNRTVEDGNGNTTIALATGTDIAGNPVISVPTSGADYTVDNIAPDILLTGANPQKIEVGTAYTESGATVTDNIDTGLTSTIDASSVDVTKVGSYTVTYDAVDAAGNNATQVTRTVNVVAAPVVLSSETVNPPAGPVVPKAQLAVATTDYTPTYYGDGSTIAQGDVKADTTDKGDDKSGDNKNEKTDVKDKKSVPLWGIIFLLILAGIGGYLFYSQSPKQDGKK